MKSRNNSRLIFLLILVGLSASSLIEYYNKNCATSQPYESRFTLDERIYKRGQEIGYGINISSYYNWLKKEGPSPVFNELTKFNIPVIITICFALGFVLIFVLFIFCFDRIKKTDSRIPFAFFVLSVVFTSLLFICFISAIVFAVGISQNFQSPVC